MARCYSGKINFMRDQVLSYIRRCGLMKAGDRVLVAASGGADSVALLRLLLELRSELGIMLAVSHFNHGLRGENSEADEAFVVDLAGHHGLEVYIERRSVSDYASAQGIGLESAGRQLRYEWLTRIALQNRFDAVATAHTLDDQAETVLMKFLRGAGTKGLAGIYPKFLRGGEKKVCFVRPLLQTTRTEVESYLESLNQPWREDETNLDQRFRRNRVRHELLPLLERDYNPNLRQVLSDVAEINRGEEEYWARTTELAVRKVLAAPQTLRLCEFAELEPALQRRVLKHFLDRQDIACDFHHLEAVRHCALGGSYQVDLPDGWVARRQADLLLLSHPEPQPSTAGYSYQLTVPGEIQVPEIGCLLRAVPVPAGFADEAELGILLNADRIGPELQIRNWRPGDRYHASYRGKQHKLKTLFQERHIAVSGRPLWPLALKGSDVVWVRGLPVSNAYCWRPGDGNAIRLDCVMLDAAA